MSAAFFVEWGDDEGSHKEVYRDFGTALAQFTKVITDPASTAEDAALRWSS